MAASSYQVISREVANQIFRHTEYLDTHICINNPHWQNSEIIIFLCKYDIVISEILVGSFLDVLFCLLTVILSEFHEKPRRKVWVTEKIHRRICVRDIIFWNCTPSFLCHSLLRSLSSKSLLFVCFLCLLLISL